MPEDFQERQFKVNILFKEYDALRAELIGRMNSRYAIIGLVAAVFAFVATGRDDTTTKWVVASIALSFFVFMWVSSWHLIARLNSQLVDLEARINQLARGEPSPEEPDLLTWETRQKNARQKIGVFRRYLHGLGVWKRRDNDASK